MVARKHLTPVEDLLALLDEGLEAETRPYREIENLPIGEARAQLHQLRIDNSLPPNIKALRDKFPSPAQQVTGAASEENWLADEIEGLGLDEVRTRLNSLGVNYAAGLQRVRELL